MPARFPLGWSAVVGSVALHVSAAWAMGAYGTGRTNAGVAPTDLATVEAIDTFAAPETIPDPVPAPVNPPPAAPEHAPATAAEATNVHSSVLRNEQLAPTSATPAAPSAPAEASSAVTAADDALPTFAMTVGAAAVAPGGKTRVDGGAAPSIAPAKPAIADANGVDELAKLVSGPQPKYPREAVDQGIEADVPLDIVVDASGRVVDVRATKHVGYGLDEAAATAIRTWEFTPAKRDGHAVPVRLRWTVTFRVL